MSFSRYGFAPYSPLVSGGSDAREHIATHAEFNGFVDRIAGLAAGSFFDPI
jgi:hypothetical protein